MGKLHEEAESEEDIPIVETRANTKEKKNMTAINHPTELILNHSRRQK